MSEVNDITKYIILIEDISQTIWDDANKRADEIRDMLDNMESENEYESPQGFSILTGSYYNDDEYNEAVDLYFYIKEDLLKFWDKSILPHVCFLSPEQISELKIYFMGDFTKTFEEFYNI